MALAKQPSIKDRPEARADTSGTQLRFPSAPACDAELVRWVMERRPEAPALLFARFAPDINRVLWKLLGADAEHNDLVHDVFLLAWSEIGRGKVEKPESLASWVIGVAVRQVRHEIRRRAVRRRYLGAQPVLAAQAVPFDAEAADLLRKLYGMLDQLEVDDRLAFCLRYLDRRTLPESAEACGCSLATVKRRIARARKRLFVLAAPYPELRELLRHPGDTDEGETP